MKKIIFIIIIIASFFNAQAQSWLTTGNTGTGPAVNFVGTIDNVPLVFRVKNNFAGIIDSSRKLTSLGYGAGKTLSGTANSAYGYKSLHNNTGSDNTAFGQESLFSNTSGYSNTAVGSGSLRSNTTGSMNTAGGGDALLNNTIGKENVSVGHQSSVYNSSGSYNTVAGVGAFTFNTTGSRNTAIGRSSLFSLTTGNDNTANGYGALYGAATGSWNTASGSQALQSISAGGAYNTAFGGYTMYYNGHSQYNTALGYNAGSSYTLGSNNVFLGANSKTTSAGYYNVVAIGQNAACTRSNLARIGNSSVTSIGGYVGWTNISDGRFKKDITANVPGLSFILKLSPVTYQLDVSGLAKKLLETKNADDVYSETATRAKEKIVYTGFIAQQVEAVAKQVGYDFSGVDKPVNEKDLYGIRYAEFVVPLVKAVQEHEDKLNEMDKDISSIKQKTDMLEALLKSRSAVTVK